MKFKPLLCQEARQLLSEQPVELFKLIKAFGSPLNLIFPEKFTENVAGFRSIFFKHGINGQIFFACKANKSHALLESASYSGLGTETSSIYELRQVLSRGIDGNNIIVSGPTKSREFLHLALKTGCFISIDDACEIDTIVLLVKNYGFTAPKIILRIGDLSPRISRFGIQQKILNKIYDTMIKNEFDLSGFSFHLTGYSTKERVSAISKVVGLIDKARSKGFSASILDIGGGFSVNYINKNDWDDFCLKGKTINSPLNRILTDFYPYHSKYEKEQHLDKVLLSKIGNNNVSRLLKQKEISLFIEPGRALLDQVGIMLTKIKSIHKTSNDKNIINLEANINDLSEQWFNTEFLVDPILITQEKRRGKKYKALVGGNLCLENDVIAWREVEFSQEPLPGDLLAFVNTAGYMMDTNESQFHLIPCPSKIALTRDKESWIWVEDKNYNYFEKERNDL